MHADRFGSRTRCALARRESRGAHSRIDFPKLDDAWGKKNNVVGEERRRHDASEIAVAGNARGFEKNPCGREIEGT